jgi:hypothetical protein
MRLDHSTNGQIIITTPANSCQLLISVLRIWISDHAEHRNVNVKAQDKAIDNICTKLQTQRDTIDYSIHCGDLLLMDYSLAHEEGLGDHLGVLKTGGRTRQ